MKEADINHPLPEEVETLYQLYSTMGDEQKGLFLNLLIKDMGKTNPDATENPAGNTDSMQDFLLDKKYDEGLKCPYCGRTHVVRNGKKAGRQRFLCRDCRKSFSATTNTILFKTRYDLATWERYLQCLVSKLPLRRCSEVCGISLNTAFIWRHKVLDTLRQMQEQVVLNGVVEADETYTPLSFKGNHDQGIFELPREPKKRGEPATQRGLSEEQVCVTCGINLNGLSVGKVSNLGKPKFDDLKKVLNGKIAPESILVTDSFSAYRRLSQEMLLNHVKIRKGHRKNGAFNIQMINNYHGQFKNLINDHFRGVATKYLNNYIVYHNFMNYSKGNLEQKWAILADFSLTAPMKVTIKDVVTRNPVPIF